MRQNMKELLSHLQHNNYSSEDVVDIISSLKEYFEAVADFQKSKTPESEALARWRMVEAKEQWSKTVRYYDLPKRDANMLY